MPSKHEKPLNMQGTCIFWLKPTNIKLFLIPSTKDSRLSMKLRVKNLPFIPINCLNMSILKV